MKLQFAFGNPRRGKKKTKARKAVAKRRKKAKTKSVKNKKLAKALKKAVRMAGIRRRRKKKNPVTQMAFKTKDGKKKLAGSATFPLKHEYEKKINSSPAVKKMVSQLMQVPLEDRQKVRLKILEVKKQMAKKYIDDIAAKQKYMQRLEEEGAEIKSYIHKEKSVAKKKKKKGKKASKKKASKASRRKSKKKASRKSSRKAKKVNRKKTKKASRKKKYSKKASKKASRRRKKRRYPKMIAHKHSKTTRHIKKGSTAKISAKKRKGRYKISAHFGKGKKKVRVSGSARVTKKGLLGRLKINPFGRNPMKNLSAQSKKYLGLDAAELTSLAVGGALVPLANGAVGKFMPQIASMVSQYVGPQAAGSIIPILAGGALNAIAEHGVKSGQGHELLKKAGEGLAAAGVIGLFMSLSQRYVAPVAGLSGINYTPTMRGMGIMPQLNGINYTPNMSGINYTPNMGIMPQLNGMGSVDFGAANYGGGGGSKEARTQRSDFGAWDSQDSEATQDEENSYSSSMN